MPDALARAGFNKDSVRPGRFYYPMCFLLLLFIPVVMMKVVFVSFLFFCFAERRWCGCVVCGGCGVVWGAGDR